MVNSCPSGNLSNFSLAFDMAGDTRDIEYLIPSSMMKFIAFIGETTGKRLLGPRRSAVIANPWHFIPPRGLAPILLEQTGRTLPPMLAAVPAFVAGLGVTIRATRRNFSAALPGVERVIGPLDFRVLAHIS
jgi:hypothetical protein